MTRKVKGKVKRIVKRYEKIGEETSGGKVEMNVNRKVKRRFDHPRPQTPFARGAPIGTVGIHMLP